MQKSANTKSQTEKPLIEKARDIIRKNPTLIWYSKNYDGFDLPCIVEAVLNYGEWDEFKELINAVGIEEVAKIFYQHANQPRCNYKPEIKNSLRKFLQEMHLEILSDKQRRLIPFISRFSRSFGLVGGTAFKNISTQI